jgi:hypothetical protein
MKMHLATAGLALALVVLAMSSSPSTAQQTQASPANAVSAVITIEARHGNSVPAIEPPDVMVFEGRDRDKVTNVVPLTGDRAGLELFLLIDDAAGSSFDSQLQDLKKFISAQPVTTLIGVGYMRNGAVEVVQNPTADRGLASKALRLPLGDPGSSPSPYFSLEDLTKRWPAAPLRRGVLMMSDGVDRFYGSGPDDPYIGTAVDALQKAGIMVYAIYTPGVGHYGHSPWSMNWGQNYLSEVAERTGGEMYNYGMGAAVSFAPFLNDLSERLTHQLLVSFIPKPENKPGLRSVRFRTEVPNAELAGPDRVYVP